MSRIAKFLFPPAIAAALMFGLLAIACLGSIAWADEFPSSTQPTFGPCDQQGCDTKTPCESAATCLGNTNNCEGCAPAPEVPESSFDACSCLSKY